ncbi:MAG TPA: TldD/PmbA family protein, partial [Candidatus Saccharimonadales bacterium]|nr:TldD/PmbA family protein [Candidatus Saccharimonadales bacterium]
VRSAPEPVPVPAEIVSPASQPPSDVHTSRKIDVVRRAADAARRRDPRVTQVTCLYRDTEQKVWVADSDGRFVPDLRVLVTLHVTAVAKERDRVCTGSESVSETRGFELFDLLPPEQVGDEAARQAVLQLGARPAPAGTFTVVLSSKAGGTMVHEACGHGLEADFIEKGMSVYTGKLGQQVASPLVSVVDDGRLPHRRGTSAVDDEGSATTRVVLIENGMLRGYLHSRRTARHFGTVPTGNGRRESYRHLPIPRMRNTLILPGNDDPASILAGVRDGIFVCRMGGGEVDVATGNFVFNCSEAYRIRDGRLAEPVRDATLVGNGPEVLSTIDAIGSDLGFGVGTCGKEAQGVPVSDAQPTLRIPSIVVGGLQAESAPPGEGRRE